MRSPKEIISYCLILVLIIGCASSKPVVKSRSDDFLSKLDPVMIEKIKTGISPYKVFAVIDFDGMENLRGKANLRLADMLTTALTKTRKAFPMHLKKLFTISIFTIDFLLTGHVQGSCQDIWSEV